MPALHFGGSCRVKRRHRLPSGWFQPSVPGSDSRKYGDIYRWRTRNSLAAEDAVVSGSPLWLLDTILADAAARGRTVIPEAVERIRAGEREGLKPRGRKKSAACEGAVVTGAGAGAGAGAPSDENALGRVLNPLWLISLFLGLAG